MKAAKQKAPGPSGHRGRMTTPVNGGRVVRGVRGLHAFGERLAFELRAQRNARLQCLLDVFEGWRKALERRAR